MNMKSQVKRSLKVLRRSDKEGVIPMDVLHFAQGIVFMTQIKGAYLFSGTLGGGIFMKRLEGDTWSPPVSVGMASFGAGLQIGAQKADIVIVLNDKASVKAFESHGQLKLGGDYAVSAGPIGRTAKAELGVSGKGFSGCFSYSMSQGLFIGVSLEGTVIGNRSMDNRSFYKSKEAHLSTVLSGTLPVPEEKDKRKNVMMLHLALNNLSKGRPFEFGMDQIESHLDLKELDDLDTASKGHNARDDDDLVRRQKSSRDNMSAPTEEKDLAANGKELLLGALDNNNSADLLGLGDYDAGVPAAAPLTSTATPLTSTATPLTSTATPLTSTAAVESARPVSHRNLVAGGTLASNQVAYGAPRVIASRDHLLDEAAPDMAAHNIICLQRGDPAFLIDGTLEMGLPPPYHDYVTVQRLADGKTGKVSRYCLVMAYDQ